MDYSRWCARIHQGGDEHEEDEGRADEPEHESGRVVSLLSPLRLSFCIFLCQRCSRLLCSLLRLLTQIEYAVVDVERSGRILVTPAFAKRTSEDPAALAPTEASSRYRRGRIISMKQRAASPPITASRRRARA